ncbi:FkbM family methyltransferase [Acidiphilium acidophilum]|uniref:FkbM family methyltransferase n=1 Tax=Acidiphilium acidophilum TaxID=76588 RepID=UPI002E8E7169|nr:FkbM family methyltransferase [Acidiphilium acidophilum]
MTTITGKYGSFNIIETDKIISESIKNYGEWAENEIKFISQFIEDGFVVADIGSFIGTHAVAFSKFVGKNGNVYAFEARSEFFDYLKENVEQNKLLNVILSNVGIGRSEYDVPVLQLDLSIPDNFGGISIGRADTKTGHIKIKTLDSFYIKKLDLIKLDVEGMELDALHGAENTISRCRPVIIAECNSLKDGIDIINWCNLHKYYCYGVIFMAYNELNYFDNAINMFNENKETSLLMIPYENKKSYNLDGAISINSPDDLCALLLQKPQYMQDIIYPKVGSSCKDLAEIIDSDRLITAEYLYSQKPITLSYFTICASNYLGFARILSDSLQKLEGHPSLTVFLIDDAGDYEEIPGIILRSVSETMTTEEFVHRRAYYNILELSTSVKPSCFLRMFELGHDHVVYLDPDIYVFRPMAEVIDALRVGANVILIPHILSSLPDDGCHPDDLDILKTGIYNLGFAAMRNSERTRSLLNWWDNKLRYLCLSDPREGVFTDQKWMDFVPAFESSTIILRHVGYNVAYWNLHERRVTQVGGEWFVEFEGTVTPLVFFHFSGFNPNKATDISKYQNRISADSISHDLSAMFEFYSSALVSFDVIYRTRSLPELRFASGERWDDISRQGYKKAIAENVTFSGPINTSEFVAWMGSPAPGDHISRYLRVVMELRPDVRTAFNDGRDIRGLAKWLETAGVIELGIDSALLSRFGITSEHTLLWGINYVGYLTAHLGLGEAARNYILAFTRYGIPVSLTDVSHTSNSSTGSYEISDRFSFGSTFPYPVTIFHINADQLPYILEILPYQKAGTIKIGFWAWESPEFPEKWSDRFLLLDEIWVASEFMAQAIREKATIPVYVVPHVVNVPPVNSLIPSLRSRHGIAEYAAAAQHFREPPHQGQ